MLAETQTTDLTVVHDRGMATAETLLWYAQHQQRFISPVTRRQRPASRARRRARQRTYWRSRWTTNPSGQAALAAPGYYGVWREYTLTHDGQSVRLRLLVVHSVGKARLDAEKRQTLLAQAATATGRDSERN